MSICSTAFSIKPLHEHAYELGVQFLDKNNHVLSGKTFTFVQESSLLEGTIWDVFTKNGLCDAALPFTKSDVKDVKHAANMLPRTLSTPLVCVLDLKDPSTGYLPNSSSTQTIAACERAVCTFLQNPTASEDQSAHSKKIHTLFKSSVPLDFVFREGSLKMDLLTRGGFTDSEVEYLQLTPSGKISCCALAECFMNGFKQGDTGYSESAQFPPHRYIEPISTKFKVFQPYKVSTVFYPALYQNIYSPTGNFATALEPRFTSTGNFDPITEITTLTVEKK